MGILSSLFTGVSGLNANGNALSVVGNNIANLSTVGFKSSRSVFADLISSSLGGGGERFRPVWVSRSTECRGTSAKVRSVPRATH